jgi:Mn2+/Fe2+ NRAMP family transporter
MKLIPFLSAAAFLALGVSLLALSLGAQAVGSYATAAAVLVLLGAVRDYTPRRSCWEPGRARTARFPSAPAGRSERLAA